MTKFLRLDGLDAVPASLKGAAVAIGNFDGVHRGHQYVMGRLRADATARGVPAVMVTLEPHPRDVFAPAPFLFRLTEGDAKARLAETEGLDAIAVLPFSREFSQIEAEDFVARFLIEALAVSSVTVGADFHFGRGRRGTPDFLKGEGDRLGFAVTVLDLLDEGEDHISSSRVRAGLAAGDVTTANQLLGYHWFFSGIVVRGDQRGKELGYPTANIDVPAQIGLAQGVYAVRVRLGGRLLDGVASFGKPMFGNERPPFEVNIFDFSEDLYGQRLEVALIGHVRGQMIFGSLDELILAIGRDAQTARAMLAEAEPLSDLDRRLGFFG